MVGYDKEAHAKIDFQQISVEPMEHSWASPSQQQIPETISLLELIEEVINKMEIAPEIKTQILTEVQTQFNHGYSTASPTQ